MQSKTIFIIEDDPDICELMKIVLENESYEVRTFLKIEKFKSYIVKRKPDLIITDLGVSGVDGATIVRSLKTKKDTHRIPAIIVSAKNSLADIAKNCKADAFLSKPFNIKDLVTVVKKFTN